MKKVKLVSKHLNGLYNLQFSKYVDNDRTAIKITTDGEVWAVATVNLPVDLAPNCVLLKGWSENEGIPAALESAGIVKLTGRTFETGFAEALEAELLEQNND